MGKSCETSPRKRFHREGNVFVADDARNNQILETKYKVKIGDVEWPVLVNRCRKSASYQVTTKTGNKIRYYLPKNVALEIIAELDADKTPKPDSVN